MSEVILRMQGIHKYFPGVHALDNVQLEVRSGEVMALVGENGAGKSTLMKILAGVYKKDSGEIEINGKTTEINNPGDAQNQGVCIVHQELNLMQDLTVAENIYIGREPMKGLFVDSAKQNKMTEDLLQSLHLDISPKTVVKNLTVARQQMIEIAKALSFDNTKLLILDEPSAALTETEIEELFTFIRRLKKIGVGIIYISHRMDELEKITDRITVMRDGQYIGTYVTGEITIDQIIQKMVGHVIHDDVKTHSDVMEDAEVVLEVRNLVSDVVRDVSFVLKKGEILGFAGLMGAGRTETARLICGADPMLSGEIFINGEKIVIQSTNDAVKAGIGYLSEDRRRYGLCTGLSVADNTVLPSLEMMTTGLFVNRNKVYQTTKELVDRINIKTSGVDVVVNTLSGGNMQKVVLAKWLLRDCDILIFDEPTRGIDVGAKSEIYKLMKHLVEDGKSSIMISSEIPELLRMSDRIVVMCEGKKTGEIDISDATQERIMAFATNREAK